MSLFKGCGTALVTPFTEDGNVDYETYAALIDRQVAGGVDFLVALATTGETPTLTIEEKKELLRLTKEHSGGKPILVGCGSNSVPGTLANMAALDSDAVDGWLVVVPFYNKPTQEGQYRYFKAVAAESKKPVVLYNVPGRTGANMAPETCLRLARDVENIVATKEASGKFDQVKAILKDAPEGFDVISGDDDMTFSLMKEGAVGVISVASNLAPAEVSGMTRAAAEGRWEEAGILNSRLSPLFRNCFVESSPIPVKAAMAQMGLLTNALRLPLVTANDVTEAIMADTIKNLWS